MANGKLTPRQQRFVAEYLVDLNAMQAAIRAGYSAKTAEVQGPRLLGNVRVNAAVEAAMEERAKRTGITQDWVLQTIYETTERCKQARPVLDRKGEPVTVETPSGELAAAYTFDAGAVLKGAELAGRHLKLFTDKQERDVNLNVNRDLSELSTAELKQQIAEALEEVDRLAAGADEARGGSKDADSVRKLH